MPFLKTVRDGVVLSVRLTPGAAAERIEGLDRREGAEAALKVKVRARPEAGAANRALLALLSEKSGLQKSAFEVISGHASRRKKVLVRGDAAAIVARLEVLAE
ncbi:MAG TPA: DUF167 family protein [Sphingomonadales bacterium]|nr:DUF167 family protein [Sphingomonadales bacterium]